MKTRHRLAALLTLALSFVVAPPAWAHDFWIEPSSFTPAAGQRISVRLRVGQSYQGDPLPRDPALYQRFDTVGAGGTLPVIGITGRDPAGYATFTAPGFYWIVYGSNSSSVELAADKFEAYLTQEGLETIRDLRAKKGQSAKGVKEHFSRCAKAAVEVGATPGERPGFDTVLGLTLELIPEQDPSALKAGGDLPLRLLYQGKPLAGALVVAIPRSAPDAKVQARTDAKGKVKLRFDRPGDWMIKAVHMIAAPAGSDFDWQSYWASITFTTAK